MKRGAERLLGETESLVDALHRAVAQGTARLEAVFEGDSHGEPDLDEAEEVLREERAEALLRQYKAQSATRGTRTAEGDDREQAESAPTPDGPEKTIGRMRTPRADEDAS
jgi:hypothetical protein